RIGKRYFQLARPWRNSIRISLSRVPSTNGKSVEKNLPGSGASRRISTTPCFTGLPSAPVINNDIFAGSAYGRSSSILGVVLKYILRSSAQTVTPGRKKTKKKAKTAQRFSDKELRLTRGEHCAACHGPPDNSPPTQQPKSRHKRIEKFRL